MKRKKAVQIREITARQCKAAHILSMHLSLVKLITVQSNFYFICTVVSQVSVQRHHYRRKNGISIHIPTAGKIICSSLLLLLA